MVFAIRSARQIIQLSKGTTRTIFARPMSSSEETEFQPEVNFEARAAPFFVFEQVETDVFRTDHLSTNRQGSAKAAYGGLIFSQALAAAENTVDDSLKPHSMHSFFLLNVDTALPIQYQVRRIRDGRSFCTRTVEAVQEGKIAFCMQVSFHKLEPDSIIHQDKMPEVPHWSELVPLNKAIPLLVNKVKQGDVVLPPAVEKRLLNYKKSSHQESELFEVRPTDFAKYFGMSSEKSMTSFCWFRTKGSLNGNEKLHRYLVAFNTDSTMAGSIFRPHFMNGFDLSMAFSLDHNVWMHEHEMKADSWLLFENSSTVAGRGRGFSTGKLWTEDGKLLLSSTQEALVRTRGDVSRL